mgnify:FL=1
MIVEFLIFLEKKIEKENSKHIPLNSLEEYGYKFHSKDKNVECIFYFD